MKRPTRVSHGVGSEIGFPAVGDEDTGLRAFEGDLVSQRTDDEGVVGDIDPRELVHLVREIGENMSFVWANYRAVFSRHERLLV